MPSGRTPSSPIFLTLALGFVIGRFRVGSFRPGNVVGTLLAGVLVGQLDIQVAPVVKVVFFDLFLFATGYKVGPQFFRGLKKNALSQVLLTIVLCVTSLVVTVAAAKVMGYDCGTAAGLMAGAFTESTVIGTAGDTISRLPVSEAETTRLLDHIPVAYAVSYLVGTGFVVWFLSSLAPRLLKVDLKEESEEARGDALRRRGARGGRPVGLPRVGRPGLRARRRLADRTVADLETILRARPGLRPAGAPRRDGSSTPSPRRPSQPGDVVVVAARRHVLLAEAPSFGVEVEDRELLDFPVTTARRGRDERARSPSGRSTSSPRSTAAASRSSKLVRGGEDVPFAPERS